MDSEHIAAMNANLARLFRAGLRVTFGSPRRLAFALRTLLAQKLAVRRRARWERMGVHVPPYLIVSVTARCNLRCRGCYARAHGRSPDGELPLARLGEILAEAEDLGSSVVFLAGGEPFLRPGILDLTGERRRTLFPVFTNGLLIDDGIIARLRRQPHVVPVVSLEGHEAATDARRGRGVYRRVREVIARLGAAGVLCGVSLTVTRGNFAAVTDPDFVRAFKDAGCGVFFFVEYVPVAPGTGGLVLDGGQRAELIRRAETLQERLKVLCIPFPGDEGPYGGCLSAGRGFVHVAPDGGLEPCPFAPFSDASLKKTSLKEALRSGFLRTLRENHSLLTESDGGCALWTNRAWVESLLADPPVGA
ncbi:MAG TPA: radical SAM protein [bacterium]|nr:radical SAM protein [bacterium]